MFNMIALLALVSSGNIDPNVTSCSRIEQQYGQAMITFRYDLEKLTTDTGGTVDASFVKDINFALVEAKEFVHTNIQHIQRSGVRGEKPSAQACRNVAVQARAQIGQYARYLLNDVNASDKEQRQLALDEFRLELQSATNELRGF